MKIFNFLLKYPKLIITLIILLSVFFGYKAFTKLELNNSIFTVMPSDHPAIKLDNEIKKNFNSREMILVGVISDDGIFNPRSLKKIKALSEEIGKITIVEESDIRRLEEFAEQLSGNVKIQVDEILKDGITAADKGLLSNLILDTKNNENVSAEFKDFLGILKFKFSPISDIISLADVDNITSTDWGLNISSPMKNIPSGDSELNKLKSEIFGNDMFVNGLVSADGTGSLILIEMSFFYDDYPEISAVLFSKLKELVKPYRGPEDIHLAGVPMVNVYTSEYMSSDLAFLTPLVILVVVIILFYTFRNWYGVVIPLCVVLASLTWTLGLMAILGRPITIVVSAMPVMLIAIGIADGIHLFAEFQQLLYELKDKKKAVMETMRMLARPVIFTSLTTMAGFASLATSGIQSIRDFGLFTSFGVFTAMIFSLTFIPSFLILINEDKMKNKLRAASQNYLSEKLAAFGSFIQRKKTPVFSSVVILIAISIIAISQIEVGSTMVGNFKSGSEIYKASEMLNSKFGGTEVMNIVINTGKENGIKEPELLAKIAALQDTLESHRLVGYSTSLADYIKRINYVMNSGDEQYNRIPPEKETIWETFDNENGSVETDSVEIDGEELIGQYLLLYENAGGEYLGKMTDFDYSKANIVIQIRTDDTPKIRKIENIARKFASENFAGIATVSFAGCASLCVVADDLIIPSQLKSLGVAFGIVFLLLIAIFRSVKYSAIGLLPIILTVIIAFAMMSLFGVHLDAGTALIASIVLGIGVDYSVHILSRFSVLKKSGLSTDAALQTTFKTSGKAIIFNSLAVAFAFLILLFSSFWPVIHIGWLVAVNMILSAIFAIVLIPLLLKKIEK